MLGAASAPLMALLSSVVPKPLRPGEETRGPPLSCQLNEICGALPLSLTDQWIATNPAGVERAPCLAALVASSWMTRAKPCVALELSSSCGPSIVARDTKPAHSRAITSLRGAPFQSD